MILYRFYTNFQKPPADELNFIHERLGSLWWRYPAMKSVQNTPVHSAGWTSGTRFWSVLVHRFWSWEEKLWLEAGFQSRLFTLLTSYLTQSWLSRQSWRWRWPAARGRVRQTDGTCFQSRSEISWLQIQRSWRTRAETDRSNYTRAGRLKSWTTNVTFVKVSK